VTVLVDRESPEPVYSQIARQIREGIVGGQLRAGEALPAVRSLAQDLGVNLNTVARAYRLLELDGFVRIRDRSGAEVVPPPTIPADTDRARMTAELRKLLARMRQAGLVPEDLRRIAEVEIGRLAGESPRESS
jgi:DNA-binding transcriptional regulator YhcF (GntR family)